MTYLTKNDSRTTVYDVETPTEDLTSHEFSYPSRRISADHSGSYRPTGVIRMEEQIPSNSSSQTSFSSNDVSSSVEQQDCVGSDSVSAPLIMKPKEKETQETPCDKRKNDECPDVEEHGSSSQKWGRDHVLAVLALCSVMLVQSYLLISVFPYSGYMAVQLLTKSGHKDINASNVGTYAGILSSAFMVGRFLSSLGWGQLADNYGRRTALMLSVSLSGFFSLLFGMSPTYGLAVFFRMCLGLSNGIPGTVKTLVSELSKGNHTLEEKTMGFVIGIWGYGFLLCPAISGMLSEPLEQYPHFRNELMMFEQQIEGGEESSPWWAFGGFTLDTLKSYPFILPNLIAVFWCVLSLVLVLSFIPETLPQNKRRQLTFRNLAKDACSTINSATSWIVPHLVIICGGNDNKTIRQGEAAPLMASDEETTSFAESNRNNKGTTYSTCNVESREHDEEEENIKESSQKESVVAKLWSNKATRDHLLVYWSFSFFSILLDEAFPLFCMSLLHLSESKIGQILTGAGLLFVLGQYATYTWLTDTFGLYGALKMSLILSSPLPFLLSFSTWINEFEEVGETNGHLSNVTFLYLSFVLGIAKVMVSSFFATITVCTNRTVDMSLRASVNGLGMMGGSIAKAAGPTCAGVLVSLCHGHGPVDGLLIFGAVSSVGIVLSFVTRHLNEQGCHSRL